ncbi:alpha/beta hydrolase [Paraburkholderia dipogonis]|uniref:alpha/beta hydrolase n=1 Tax=Paraburkholderia dipogonis TaxID=1211383 RepID=UPI001FCB4652|nr:hypothetical protein [Paraburkholderia dipogonis]
MTCSSTGARRRFISLSLTACAAGVIACRARKHDEPGGIAYGNAPHQRLDVYMPESSSRTLHPVVVYFYGAWQSGDRPDSRGVAQALAAHGIVTIAADYRTYPETVFQAFSTIPLPQCAGRAITCTGLGATRDAFS